MDAKDYIGERGEAIFVWLITRRCDGQQWFRSQFLGAKEESIDFRVTLIDPKSGEASFLVQVKATARGYAGEGARRKLNVGFSRTALTKLQNTHSPAYIVGIDIHGNCGYILAITASMKKGFSRMPTRHPLDCETIKTLWREVDEYWKNQPTALESSQFS